MEAFKSHLLSHFYIYSSHSQTLTFTNGVKMERNKKIRFQCLNPNKTNPSSRMMHWCIPSVENATMLLCYSTLSFVWHPECLLFEFSLSGSEMSHYGTGSVWEQRAIEKGKASLLSWLTEPGCFIRHIDIHEAVHRTPAATDGDRTFERDLASVIVVNSDPTSTALQLEKMGYAIRLCSHHNQLELSYLKVENNKPLICTHGAFKGHLIY